MMVGPTVMVALGTNICKEYLTLGLGIGLSSSALTCAPIGKADPTAALILTLTHLRQHDFAYPL